MACEFNLIYLSRRLKIAAVRISLEYLRISSSRFDR